MHNKSSSPFQLNCSVMAVIIISLFFLAYEFNDHNPIKLAWKGLRERASFTSSIIDDHVDDFSHARLKRDSIKAIYQFGDSLSDTGNFKWENPYSSYAQLPYGMHEATGRCSDGLLIVDYLAKFLNLPFLEAYLNKEGNFTHGANFAVIGATALNSSTLLEKNITSLVTNHSLSMQLGWFKLHLKSICSDKSASECRNELAKALFIVGEIGANDYNFAISGGKPPPEVYQMVPEVVLAISNVVEEVISLGATQVVVPGNFPIGCMTIYLSVFKSNDSSFFDELKCIKLLNEFAEFHNDQLSQAIEKLRRNHPNVAIVYMDLAKGLIETLQHATSLGFDKNSLYKTCCGISDNEYNFNSSRMCGTYGVPACEHPRKHVNWDGFHLTDHAYHEIAKLFIRHAFDGSSTALT